MKAKNIAKFLLLLGLALLLTAALTAPATQKGEVEVTLDGDGVALVQVPFPRAFRAAPVVVVTPRGEQGFVVDHFFADAFDGTAFALGVEGAPGARVKFYWVAMER